MSISAKKPTVGGLIGQHVIVFLICVVFPGAVTGLAPSTWISFVRKGESVDCTTRTCVFFVVPYSVKQVSNVTTIGSHERAGGTRKEMKNGRAKGKKINVDGEGFLEILGADSTKVEVNVSPASLESVVKACQDFLESREADSKTIFAIANWKFGAIMGGILTSFTVLYVVGYSMALLLGILKSLRRVMP
jgi:hypothetical protein